MDTKSTNQHGKSEVRLEDDALVRGAGRFVEDAPQPNQAYAAFVRSPHAHARMVRSNAEAAQGAGRRRGAHPPRSRPPASAPPRGIRRSPAAAAKLIMPFRPALAGERVMHVGEAGRAGGRRDARAGQDAAEQVAVEYEELPAVVDPRDAMQSGAPQLPPKRRAMSRSTGRASVGRRRQCARGRRDHRRRRMSRASRASTSASSSTRWSRAARPRATTRRPTATRCAPARRARAPQRDQIVAMMGMAEREAARHHRGRRRRVRPEDPGLSGISGLLVAAKQTGRPVPGWRRARNRS